MSGLTESGCKITSGGPRENTEQRSVSSLPLSLRKQMCREKTNHFMSKQWTFQLLSSARASPVGNARETGDHGLKGHHITVSRGPRLKELTPSSRQQTRAVLNTTADHGQLRYHM